MIYKRYYMFWFVVLLPIAIYMRRDWYEGSTVKHVCYRESRMQTLLCVMNTKTGGTADGEYPGAHAAKTERDKG